MKLYCGIDPGKSGAIAVVSESGEARVKRLEETERDIWNWLIGELAAGHDIVFAYLEKAGSRPSQGVVSTFKFGVSYGFCRGVLTAAGIPWDTVTPHRWMRHMHVLKPAGATKTKHQNIKKAAAQRLFPDMEITHREADALLIAEYTRRMKGGRREH